MKDVKYIPGDLVMLKIYGIGVIQVCSLDGNHIIIHYLNDNIIVGCNIDSVKPIPLTKEILDKNGFILGLNVTHWHKIDKLEV